MLIELKAVTEYRDFSSALERYLPDLKHAQRANLMTLARNMQLLEQHKPDSQRAG